MSDSFNQPYAPPPPASPTIEENLVSPTATYFLTGFTILIYLGQMASQALTGNDLLAVWGMKNNLAIIAGEYWRFITPMFLHGSLLHIGFNMYALVVIGSGLERRFGHERYLLLYFLGGFAGNVFSFLFSPAYSLGASTSIFGLLGAEMVFFYQNRELFGKGARRALQNVIMVAGINLVIGLSPGIDNWGHLGGLMGGLIFSWFAGPLLRLSGNYPSLKVVDQRTSRDQFLGAGLVLISFGFFALAKIIGLLP